MDRDLALVAPPGQFEGERTGGQKERKQDLLGWATQEYGGIKKGFS